MIILLIYGKGRQSVSEKKCVIDELGQEKILIKNLMATIRTTEKQKKKCLVKCGAS